MSDTNAPQLGTVGWMDLTVADAAAVRDFYREVAEWEVAQEIDMGGYADFVMRAPGSETPLGGVCHARGANAALPPVWLMYIIVADLDRSLERCAALGGEVVAPPRGSGGTARFAVVRDPGGAVVALYQP